MAKAIINPVVEQYEIDYDNLEEYLEYAWLEIGDVRNLTIDNKMLDSAWEDNSKAAQLIVETCRNPEYLHFFCKYILNIDLLPYQCVMLQMLWFKTLPMVIASRGTGKSFLLAIYVILRAVLHQGCTIVVVGASLRQSMIIYNYIEKIWNSAPRLRDIVGLKNKPMKAINNVEWRCGNSKVLFLPLGDGCLVKNTLIHTDVGFKYIDYKFDSSIDRRDSPHNELVWDGTEFKHSNYAYCNGLSQIKRLTTENGYEIAGTYNHKLKAISNGHIVWKKLEDLKVGDHLLIDRQIRWHTKCQPIDLDEAYALGWMIGDGCWTRYAEVGMAIPEGQNTSIDSINKSKFLHFKQCRKDPIHFRSFGVKDKKDWLSYWGMEDLLYSHQKYLPDRILSGSKESMMACLSGLFDADGHVQISTAKGGYAVTIGYTTVSKKLVEQIHTILLSFGIVSHLTYRDRNEKWNRCYELLITGRDAHYFATRIGFRLSDKQNKLLETFAIKKKGYSSEDRIPIFEQVLSYVASHEKDYPCRNYEDRYVSSCNLRHKKGCSYTILGRVIDRFRDDESETMDLFKYIYENNFYFDRIKEIQIDQECTYDIQIPSNQTYIANGFVSHNSTIRGQRANVVISDEFASISSPVFETVVRGFASTKSEGLYQNVAMTAKKRLMKQKNILVGDQEKEHKVNIKTILGGNQIVIAGTAQYHFNHFYKYYKYYKAIIQSNGDKKLLKQEFPDMILSDNIDPSEYAIMRLPYYAVPEGMMDQNMITQGQATMDPAIFDMEYNAVFSADSEGFFLASHLNKATCPLKIGNQIITCSPKLTGDTNRVCVMGVDPASENDNFSICIIELHDGFRCVVYLWSTNRKKFEQDKKDGLIDTDINDYHTFCIMHIRDLMRRFNIQMICCDAGGGGVHVKEGLRDQDKMAKNELPILDMDDENIMGQTGHKILKMIQFSSDAWRKEAHYGMRKDLLEQHLLFPEYDPSLVTISKLENRNYDTLEDAYLEILECKTETTFIKHTITPGGTERWDVPTLKGISADDEKKRLKRDRFTSLLLANWAARTMGQNTAYVPNSNIYRSVRRGMGSSTHNTDGTPSEKAPKILNVGGRKIFY